MTYALRPFTAEDADWLVARHDDHYRREEGFDETFAPLVAQIIADFLQTKDDTVEAGWIAADGAARLGSIFCVRLGDTTAKLRLFYVAPQARGTGIAQDLLTTCLDFARNAGYRHMTLWTHESHRAAGRIYTRNGFVRTAAKPVHSFGVDLVEETWEIQL